VTATVHFTGDVIDVTVIPDILHDQGNVIDVSNRDEIVDGMQFGVTFPADDTPSTAVQLTCGDGSVSSISTSTPWNGTTGGGGVPPAPRPGIGTCFSSAGFGINPVDWGPALARSGSCVTQALFIPTSVGDQWSQLQATAHGTAIDTAFNVSETILGAPLDFADTAGATGPCAGPGLDLTMLDPNIPTIYPLNACSGPEKTMADLLSLFLTISVYLGGAILCVNMFLGAFGLQGIHFGGGGAAPAPGGGE